MHCPNCGAEHNLNAPCQPSNERPQQPSPNPVRREDEHPLAGLDNPFWKPEKPAAASL
jgi:hypothetical protein